MFGVAALFPPDIFDNVCHAVGDLSHFFDILYFAGCQDSCCRLLSSAVDLYWPYGLPLTLLSVRRASGLYMKVRQHERCVSCPMCMQRVVW